MGSPVYRVTGWITWREATEGATAGTYWCGPMWAPKGQPRPAWAAWYEENRAYEVVVEEIRSGRHPKTSGLEHQSNAAPGVPVLNERFPLLCSMRVWGGLIAEAEGDTDPMAYCRWAWSSPDPEVLRG